MDIEEHWRFAGNNFTYQNGLDTADMETFKKDPIASLARESCQNSIDAKENGKDKVILEFKSFNINKEDIPGYDRLKAEIENCKEYKKTSRKEYDQLCNMSKAISNDVITCLRISDFNTTGLYGEKFKLLTTGNGITDKVGTTGGSKGIGKYASFVASTFNTVFYSTYAKDGQKKSLGISRLCSAPIPDTRELTMGIGFYGINKENEPLEKTIDLDKSFHRDEYGTDLYIMGFKTENSWKQQILSMILDSFLVAIYYEQLEIKIDDIIVNKENLAEIINNEELIINGLRKNIISQYILISESEGVFTKEIDILEYGKVKIFAKCFSKEESEIATKSCIMIRYPYMKIKIFPNISTLFCSAMCIIQDNKLNELLKDIENPQHTDWEPNRKEEGSLRNEIRNIIQNLKSSIVDFITEILSTSETKKLDIEGAENFLPENNSNGLEKDGGEQENLVIKDKPVIIKKVSNKKFTKNPIMESESLEGIIPDIGSHNEEGDDSPVPSGSNNGGGSEPHESENRQGSSEEGDEDILKHIALTDMKKIFFVSNKENGEYVVCIDSNYNESDCEIEMYYFDDADEQYVASIERCLVNGQEAEVNNGKAVKFKIIPGKTKIELKTDLRDYYRCEVKLYANR